MTDGSQIKLGNFGKHGQIDPNKDIREGITKDDIFDKKLDCIFDKADTDGNGIITRDEASAFRESIQAAAGENGKLSHKEAKTFLRQNDIKDLKSKDLFSFLNACQDTEKDPEISTAVKSQEGRVFLKSEKFNTHEATNTDGSWYHVQFEEKNFKKVKSTFQKQADGSEIGFTYDNGKKRHMVSQSSDGVITRIDFDDNEQPVAKTMKTETEDMAFDYKNGHCRAREVVEHDKGDRTTKYDYNGDGTVTRSITDKGETTSSVGAFDRDDPRLFVEGAKGEADTAQVEHPDSDKLTEEASANNAQQANSNDGAKSGKVGNNGDDTPATYEDSDSANAGKAGKTGKSGKADGSDGADGSEGAKAGKTDDSQTYEQGLAKAKKEQDEAEKAAKEADGKYIVQCSDSPDLIARKLKVPKHKLAEFKRQLLALNQGTGYNSAAKFTGRTTGRKVDGFRVGAEIILPDGYTIPEGVPQNSKEVEIEKYKKLISKD
ncbi:hypothetical protein KBA27_02255 [bacterium]|nr:hypothetical protein [bacterium]